VKIQLLPSTFDAQGHARAEQRLTCYLIDDRVAIDAGSIALALTDAQRDNLRDVIVTHPHMDHVATLPILIDDLFGHLTTPVRVHSTPEIVRMLRDDVFNDTLYPRFHELKNEHGHVLEFHTFEVDRPFTAAHLTLTAVAVEHTVPTVGLIVSDDSTTVAFSSDTRPTTEFWRALDCERRLDALFIEASFPDSMRELAEVSGHLTPASLADELAKLTRPPRDILAVHIKPTYRETVVAELDALGIQSLRVMEPGRVYEW
jgi:ribonuclease BN (tRNA processing enzyme)